MLNHRYESVTKIRLLISPWKFGKRISGGKRAQKEQVSSDYMTNYKPEQMDPRFDYEHCFWKSSLIWDLATSVLWIVMHGSVTYFESTFAETVCNSLNIYDKPFDIHRQLAGKLGRLNDRAQNCPRQKIQTIVHLACLLPPTTEVQSQTFPHFVELINKSNETFWIIPFPH